MPEITLYHYNGACSQVPHILLRHLDLPFKSVLMKMDETGMVAADGSLSNAEYRKINPAAYVPVLTVDGEVVTEQFAILTMIALQSPDKTAKEGLLGHDSLEKVRVTEWMIWLSDTLHSSGYGAFLHPERYVEGNKDMYPAVKEKGRKTIDYSYDIIEKRLKERTYTIGEHLTVVDFFLYTLWAWGVRLVKIDMKATYPAYGKLVQRVEALRSVSETVKAEKQPLHFA
ncbi:glutathione S-transferase [Xylaria bambusicola]|uniref:glutathione S-transferase n=1 Tax=Xylaria bambusicola TaxID=326684 RepID=UPI002007FF12|nr:glutathione S-transferase [Xylaria bambusicola]KAI0521707.1 glutathione S-transferase [Xylaria bambusicola]